MQESPPEIPEHWGRKPMQTKPEWTWQKTITTIAVLMFIAFMTWLLFGD